MLTSSNVWRAGGRVVLGALLALVAVFALQMPPISLRGALIGSKVLTAPELGVMEFVVGLSTSIVVSLLCVAVVRRPSVWLVMAAVLIQLIWNEVARGDSTEAQMAAELVIRYAQQVGAIVGGIAVFWVLGLFNWPVQTKDRAS